MWGSRKFYFGTNISVGVRDVDQAIVWSEEKLGLRLTPIKSEDFEAFLSFSKDDDVGLALVKIPDGELKANIEGHPILFSKKLEACREEFASRGIQVSPIQQDSGGNRFFQFQDADRNSIEVCIEP